VKFTRDGLDGAFRKVNINLTDRQIMDIRPYKWKSTPINIPISQAMRNELKLDKDFQFKWIVEPDLVEPDYLADKGTGEQAQARTFLSPRRAMLLQIVENNFVDRPIHFSNFANPVFFAGLNPFFENRGLTSRLLPIETANTKHSHDFSKFENFLTAENLKDFHTMKTHDMPRVSWGFIWGYYTATIELARHYKETNQTEKLENLINIFKTYLAIGMDEENEVAVLNWLRSK
jgi:hypothetical protein